MKSVIIGVAGTAQVGKDTLALELVKHDGFKRVAFADAMRNILYAMNPIISVNVHSTPPTQTIIRRLRDLVDELGWDKAKVQYGEIRELLQRLGTEGGRMHIADDIWVRTVLENNANVPALVIPDVRFPNEASAIKARGGIIVRIKREGYEPVNNHISETAYQDQDITLWNNGTPEDLWRNYHLAHSEWIKDTRND